MKIHSKFKCFVALQYIFLFRFKAHANQMLLKHHHSFFFKLHFKGISNQQKLINQLKISNICNIIYQHP